MTTIYTIGHSNHPIAHFLDLLARADIRAVADVRSQPVSRYAPQFNMEALMSTLQGCGLSYVFMGRALGGRPRDPALLTNGKSDYAKMARGKDFRDALAALMKDAAAQRTAILCAERDPADCHRFRLIARALADSGVEVAHILPDGSIETQTATEARVSAAKPQGDLFG